MNRENGQNPVRPRFRILAEPDSESSLEEIRNDLRAFFGKSVRKNGKMLLFDFGMHVRDDQKACS